MSFFPIDLQDPNVSNLKGKAAERRAAREFDRQMDSTGRQFFYNPSNWNAPEVDTNVRDYKADNKTFRNAQVPMNREGRRRHTNFMNLPDWNIFDQNILVTGVGPDGSPSNNVVYNSPFNDVVISGESSVSFTYAAMWNCEFSLPASAALSAYEAVVAGSGTADDVTLDGFNLGGAVVTDGAGNCSIEQLSVGACPHFTKAAISDKSAKCSFERGSAGNTCAPDESGIKVELGGMLDSLPVTNIAFIDMINNSVQISEYVPIKLSQEDNDKGISSPAANAQQLKGPGGWVLNYGKGSDATYKYNEDEDMGCGGNIISPYGSPVGAMDKLFGRFFPVGGPTPEGEDPRHHTGSFTNNGLGLRFDKKITTMLGKAAEAGPAFKGGMGAMKGVPINQYMNVSDFKARTTTKDNTIYAGDPHSSDNNIKGLSPSSIPVVACMTVEYRFEIPPGRTNVYPASIINSKKSKYRQDLLDPYDDKTRWNQFTDDDLDRELGYRYARYNPGDMNETRLKITYPDTTNYDIGSVKVTVMKAINGSSDVLDNSVKLQSTKGGQVRYYHWVEPLGDSRGGVCEGESLYTVDCSGVKWF